MPRKTREEQSWVRRVDIWAFMALWSQDKGMYVGSKILKDRERDKGR